MKLKTINGLNFKWIQSHYHRRWKGIILESHPRIKYADLLSILIIIDHSNHIVNRKMIKTLDKTWTVNIPSIDIEINSDWIKF